MFEYVTLHGKRDFANVTKVIERTLIWEDYPELSKPNIIILGP